MVCTFRIYTDLGLYPILDSKLAIKYDDYVLVVDVLHLSVPCGRYYKDRRLERMSERKKKEISRRQFLNYCLTGVGGFMAAGIFAPMIKFAIDPALKSAGAAGNKIPVASVSDITEEPQKFSFKKKIVDVWTGEQETPLTAWVYKQGDEIIALSPVCKHLGCMVHWNEPGHKDQFFCPCHMGRYEKNGKNIPGTPPPKPLDQYEVAVKDGKVMLGDVVANKIIKGA